MERFNSFSSDQIVVTKRQASMIIASMLLFCLFVFIVGFFLGKRMIMEDFSSQVTKEALHDQIDFLLTTQSLQDSQDEQMITIEAEPLDKAVISEDFSLDTTIIPSIIMEENSSQISFLNNNDEKKSKSILLEDVVLQEKKEKIIEPKQQNFEQNKQYAQLIGFGTKKAAQSFVARLKKHNITVILKTMISKTSSGKEKIWYQAITPHYQSLEELQNQISKIKRLEHIRDKDIKIVYIK